MIKLFGLFFLLVSTIAFAQDATAGAPPQPGAFGMLMPFVLMFGVVYMLIIRPQQKKLKEQHAMLDKITNGDEVLTSAGVFGKVVGVAEKVLTVEIADGVRVKMLRSGVATVNPTLETAVSAKK